MKQFIKPFESLKYRDFRLLWMGLFISWLGSQLQIVAVIWHVYKLTNSPYSLALIGFARFLPLLIISPFSGIIADKYDRKKIILLAQTISIIGALLLCVTTFSNSISPLYIYLALVLNSVGVAIDSPARQSLIPTLVPKESLLNALGLTTTMYQTTMVLGPAIAGFLIASFNIGFIYLLNALSYIAVIIAALFIKAETRQIDSKVSFSFASLKEGFIFVFSRPLIASTMLLDFFATFFASATTLLPIFAKEILSVGPQGLGLLYAAPSVGAILTGIIFSSHRHIRHQGKILIAAVSLYGLATVFFALSKSLILSFFFLTLTGVGDIISAIIRNTLRQLATPNIMRGRMTSVSMIFYLGGPHLGEVEAGLAAGMIGLVPSVILGGVATVLLTVVTYALVPKLRSYHGDEIVI